MQMDEHISPHLQLCVMAWIWAWTLNGCVVYPFVGQCFSDDSLKTALLGAEVAGSIGLLSQLSGSRPYKCFRAALLTAGSVSKF